MSESVQTGTPRVARPEVWALFVLPVLLVAISLRQFLDHDFHTLMGDDLYNLGAIADGKWASNPVQMLFGVQSDKWRPVFQIVMGVLYNLFAFDVASYVAFNIALHTASALLLYHLVLTFAPGRAFIAFTAAVLFATTRFADYQLWTVTGLVEGLSTFLFIAAVNFYALARARQREKWMWWALGCWVAAVLTHERYLVMLPAVFLAGFFWPVEGRRITRIWFVVLALGFVALHFGYRAALGERLLVGTGGKAIGFDFERIVVFLVTAIANAIGFNYGPAYLSAQPMREAPVHIFGTSIFIAFVTVSAIVFGLLMSRKALIEKPSRLGQILILLACLGGAALVAAITIRQEFRWILTVYLFVLIAFALAASAIPNRRIGVALAASLLGASLFQTSYYTKLDKSVVFFSMQDNVDKVRKVVGELPPTAGVTYLVVEDPSGQCDWGYGRGQLFKAYSEFEGGKYVCVLGIQSLPPEAALPGARIVISRLSDAKTEEVTGPAQSQMLMAAAAATGAPLYKTFDPKMLNSQQPMSTPSGFGGMALDWPTALGNVPSLVLVSGFNATVPATAVPGSKLSFAAGMPYASAVPAVLWIAARDKAGAVHRIWEESMVGPSDGVTRLKGFTVPLDGAFDGIVFGIDTPQGDASAHWAVFGSPSILPPGSAEAAPAETKERCAEVATPPNDKAVTWCSIR